MYNIAYSNVRIAYAMLYIAWTDMRRRRAGGRATTGFPGKALVFP